MPARVIGRKPFVKPPLPKGRGFQGNKKLLSWALAGHAYYNVRSLAIPEHTRRIYRGHPCVNSALSARPKGLVTPRVSWSHRQAAQDRRDRTASCQLLVALASGHRVSIASRGRASLGEPVVSRRADVVVGLASAVDISLPGPGLLSACSAIRLGAVRPARSPLGVKQLSVSLRAFPRGVNQDLHKTNQEGRCEGRSDRCAPEDLG
jgi:hypothetical protein